MVENGYNRKVWLKVFVICFQFCLRADSICMEYKRYGNKNTNLNKKCLSDPTCQGLITSIVDSHTMAFRTNFFQTWFYHFLFFFVNSNTQKKPWKWLIEIKMYTYKIKFRKIVIARGYRREREDSVPVKLKSLNCSKLKERKKRVVFATKVLIRIPSCWQSGH